MAKDRSGGALDPKRLDELIEEAIVDCYDEYEQAPGLFTKVEDELRLPFTTRVLGVEVAVVAVEQDDDGLGLVAVREREGEEQGTPLADLSVSSPVPMPRDVGAAGDSVTARGGRAGRRFKDRHTRGAGAE